MMITAGLAINSYKLIFQVDFSQIIILALQLVAYLMALYVFLPYLLMREIVAGGQVSKLCQKLFGAAPSWCPKPAPWVWEADHED